MSNTSDGVQARPWYKLEVAKHLAFIMGMDDKGVASHYRDMLLALARGEKGLNPMADAMMDGIRQYFIKNPPLAATIDGIATGLGFTLGLVLVGGCREILGSGTLFSGASLLLGPHFQFMELTLLPGYRGFLLMMLPPGGFIMMGLLLGAIRLAKRAFSQSREPAAVAPTDVAEAQGGCHP